MSRTTSPRAGWRRSVAFGAVILVPLAVAGLIVGAVSQVNDGLDSIPAAIVNNDEMQTQVQPDGTETPVLAGRQLVTELTGAESAGFDWTITNTDDAADMLASGEVYAVIEVPEDFSSSILSLSSDDPKQAKLSIRTDDAHNYLTGAVAQTVGDSLVNSFGKVLTTQYIAGIYTTIGTLGGALGDAADGAGQLADGATQLADGAGELTSGLDALSDGAASAQSGASELAGGIGDYAGGVRQLATGLRGFQSQAGALSASDVGVTQFTGGVAQLSGGLTQAVAALSADPTNPTLMATVQALTSQLAAASSTGSQVVGGVNTAFDRLASGAGQSAAGAEQLASAGSQLSSGAGDLASGLSDLSSGAASAADGAGELTTGASGLASGATELSTGLASGAEQVPAFEEGDTEAAAEIAATPVTLDVERDNEVTDLGQIIATLFVPLGLWVGAIAVFLVMRPVTRTILTSTASNGRIALSALARAAALTAAQAVLLVLLLHITLGVGWALLPATLGFALVMSLAFTAFHYLLTVWLGRAGLVLSLLLLALQVTSTGGLYPIQVLAEPFQLVSPFMPLTYGVSGMQAILAGGSVGTGVLAAVALAAFGGVSVLFAHLALRRVRRATALGLVPASV